MICEHQWDKKVENYTMGKFLVRRCIKCEKQDRICEDKTGYFIQKYGER